MCHPNILQNHHKHDTPENRERVKNIKLQITRRPNGRKLLKIANLVTTPFFTIILKYLHELKLNGYAPNFLEETLESIIESSTNFFRCYLVNTS